MGTVKRSRERELARRTGRARSARTGTRVDAQVGSPAAASYDALTARLVRLRAALAADQFETRERSDVQHDQSELTQSLGDAVACAFAAEADGSLPPAGVASWAGEGLARSRERELLLLAETATPVWPMSGSDVPTFAGSS